MSDDHLARQIADLRRAVADARSLAGAGVRTALAAVGASRTALHILQDTPLSDEAAKAVRNAHALLDRTIERLDQLLRAEAADGG